MGVALACPALYASKVPPHIPNRPTRPPWAWPRQTRPVHKQGPPPPHTEPTHPRPCVWSPTPHLTAPPLHVKPCPYLKDPALHTELYSPISQPHPCPRSPVHTSQPHPCPRSPIHTTDRTPPSTWAQLVRRAPLVPQNPTSARGRHPTHKVLSCPSLTSDGLSLPNPWGSALDTASSNPVVLLCPCAAPVVLGGGGHSLFP